VKIIIPHLGGAMAFAQYRMERRGKDRRAEGLLLRHRDGQRAGAALRFARFSAPSALMLGTDYGGGGSFKANVDYVREGRPQRGP